MKGVYGMMKYLDVRDWQRWKFLPLMIVLAYRFAYYSFFWIFFRFMKHIMIGYPVQNGTTCCIRKRIHTDGVLHIA